MDVYCHCPNKDHSGGESELPFDIEDLPPEIRMKIDEIVRNNEDLDAQIDAIDALLFGHRRQSDADIESGIDLESTSSGSNAASIASSSEYFVGNHNGGQLVTSSAMIEDVDDFVNQLMVPPPPEFFGDADVNDDIITLPPVFGFELPPPIDVSSSFQLPPVVELSEDECREPRTPVPDYDADEDCFVPPPSEFDFSVPVASSTIPEVKEQIVATSSSTANKIAPPTAVKPVFQKQTAVDLSSSKLKDSESSNTLAPSGGVTSNTLAPSGGVVDKKQAQSSLSALPELRTIPNNNKLTSGKNVVARESKSLVTASANTANTAHGANNASLPPGSSPTTVRRRFSGTTEVQTMAITEGKTKKKKKSLFEKVFKRGSLSASTTAEAETVNSSQAIRSDKTMSSHLSLDVGHTDTLPRRSKPRQPTSTSTNQLPSKATENNPATLSRSTANDHSQKQPVAAPRVSRHFFKKNGSGDSSDGNKLSPEVTVNRPSERHSVLSSFLPRSNSYDLSNRLPTKGPVKVDHLSKSARFERGLTDLNEAAAAGFQKAHWSAGEEDDLDSDNSSTAAVTSSDDEDDDDNYDVIMRRINMRSRLRDETGRLTIVPAINKTLAKATSMMALNQVGLGSTHDKSTSSSLTTDDIVLNSVGMKQNKRNHASGGVFAPLRPPASGNNSPRSNGRSPKSARVNAFTTSSTSLQSGIEEDDVFRLRRSDYLPSSSSSASVTSSAATTSSQTPSAITDRLLRRSMLVEPSDSSSLLGVDTTLWFGMPSSTVVTSAVMSLSTERDGESRVHTSNNSRTEENNFNTFRGGMKPMRWSEDANDINTSQSTFGLRRPNVLRPTLGRAVGGEAKNRMSVPPEWIFIKSPTSETVEFPSTTMSKTISTSGEDSRLALPLSLSLSTTMSKTISTSGEDFRLALPLSLPVKPKVMARPTSLVTDKSLHIAKVPTSRSQSLVSTEQFHQADDSYKEVPDQLTSMSSMTQIAPTSTDFLGDIPPPPDYLYDFDGTASGDSINDLEVLPAPPDEYTEHCLALIPPNDILVKMVMKSNSLMVKSYGSRPIHEAIEHHRDIVADLDVTKSMLLGNASIDDATTTDNFDCINELPTIVRSIVADSKNFVAAACNCAMTTGGDVSRTNAELRPVTESVIRKLAALSVACRRLTLDSLSGQCECPTPALSVIVQLVEYAVDVTSVFGEMLDACRLIVDSRSEAGRRFAVDSLNGHAVGLARVLVGFVQRVRTMR